MQEPQSRFRYRMSGRAVRLLVLALPLLAGGTHGLAAPPLPPPRPAEPDRQAAPPPPERLPESACLADLRSQGWEIDGAGEAGTAGACTVDTPVRLRRLATGGGVAFPDAPVVACRFAETLGRWLGDLAVPLIAGRLGEKLSAVRTGPGFVCRHRNHDPTAKLSAHALGLAIDVAGFALAGGRQLLVAEPAGGEEAGALRALRTGACGWFTTILGPGTDPAHAGHWHLDIQPHGSSEAYRICQ